MLDVIKGIGWVAGIGRDRGGMSMQVGDVDSEETTSKRKNGGARLEWVIIFSADQNQ